MSGPEYPEEEGNLDHLHAAAAFAGWYVVRYAGLLLLPICVSAVCFLPADRIYVSVEARYGITIVTIVTDTAVCTAVSVLVLLYIFK